ADGVRDEGGHEAGADRAQEGEGGMTTPEVWYVTLSILADFSPMAYWEMSNGAVFWWRLRSQSQLLPDRFAEQPFSYAEIVSVCVVNEVRFRQEVLSCDWP